jgi:protein FRA10AC1
MRWRIEKEVIEGKGQFICGDKRCQSRDSLKSWEVNFGYIEHSEKKNALVKLRNYINSLPYLKTLNSD